MKFLLILLIFFDTTTQLEPPEQVVNNFYKWYVDGGYKEIKPSFARLDNGKTKLDFCKYDDLLKQYGFEEKLINQSKSIYKECQQNLEMLLYSEFQQFEDIDQFEEVNCSFQFWQWFGFEMEPYKYFELIKTKKLNDNKYEVTVGLAWKEREQLSRLIPVTVERKNSDWQITNVEVKWE